MDSPTSLYNAFFGPEDDEEEEAVLNTVALAQANSSISVRSPPRPNRRREFIERERKAAHDLLMKHYFIDRPRYKKEKTFKIRFRMSKKLFLSISDDLEREFDYFKQKPDARGTLGFSPLQKVTSAVRVIGYGYSTDFNDDYLQMAEKTTRDTLDHFCQGIMSFYGSRYLRTPNWHDLQRLYEHHAKVHGLPGMIGSIDCMHWGWENCPTAWRGQFTRGDQKGPTVSLQAVASYDLWIWSAFFGVPGSNNDINVLEQSPLLESYISNTIPKASFWANDNYHPHGYYLGDGIYPDYSIIVKTYRDPIDEKREYFKKVQESSRKDIERCFGVLQKKWHFIKNPCRDSSRVLPLVFY